MQVSNVKSQVCRDKSQVSLKSLPTLKMICNDFLVVKVNCWSYVFNIMKYMWILRNVKNKNIVEKTSESVHGWFASDDVIPGKQSNHETNSLLSVECWQPIAQQHIGMTINVAMVLKTYTAKITSYRILIKRKQHKRILIWRHAWRWFPKNSYITQTTKVVLFSILRRNLSKFITQTGIYCSRQLETTFSSILWKTVAYHL